MADVLAGFLSGAKAGQAANKARAKAKADAEFKQRTQTNTIRGAGEDEWSRLETMLNDPNWESANTTRALSMASAIDNNYGGLLGRSAVDYVKQTLNLGVTQKKDSHGNRIYSTGKDGTSTAPELRSANAGYTGTTQRLKSQDLEQNARSQAVSSQIGQMVSDYIQERAEPGMPLSPADGIRYTNELEAKMVAEGNFDPTILAVEFDKARRHMADHHKAMAAAAGESQKRQDAIDANSEKNTRFLKSYFGIEPGLMGGMERLEGGDLELYNDMERFMSTLSANNVGHNAAKLYFYDRYRDEVGKMANVPPEEYYSGMMLGVSPEARSFFKKQYASSGGQFDDTAQPFYDHIENKAYMILNAHGPKPLPGQTPKEGERTVIQLLDWALPQQGPVETEPRPSPSKSKPETQDQPTSVGTGLGVDGIKAKAKGRAVAESTYGGVVKTTPYDAPPPRGLFNEPSKGQSSGSFSSTANESTGHGKIKTTPRDAPPPRTLFGRK